MNIHQLNELKKKALLTDWYILRVSKFQATFFKNSVMMSQTIIYGIIYTVNVK